MTNKIVELNSYCAILLYCLASMCWQNLLICKAAVEKNTSVTHNTRPSYRKITIIGGQGSGKTTLAARLKEILDIPVYGLDSFFRQDETRTKKNKILSALVNRNVWIIEGNYPFTYKRRIAKAELIVYIKRSQHQRMWRLFMRMIQDDKKSKLLWEEEFWKKQLEWEEKQHAIICELLATLPSSKQYVILQSDQDVEDFLTTIQTSIDL